MDVDMVCGCGRPAKYLIGNRTEAKVGACNKRKRCELSEADKAGQRIKELEAALTKIYDSPSNTDTIIDIAYDALNGNV